MASFLDKISSAINKGVESFNKNTSPDLIGRFTKAAEASFGYFFSPVGGGYASARETADVNGWPYVRGSELGSFTADEELLPDLQLLREQSRDLFKNSLVGRAAIKRLTSAVIGKGIKFQANIDAEYLMLSDSEAEEWEDTVERDFHRWARTTQCDVECRRNFYEMQKLVYSSSKASGDSFVLLPVTPTAHTSRPALRLQVIEADQVMNPIGIYPTWKFRGGVELDDYRAPLRYHIKNDNWTWRVVPAVGENSGRKNILHLMESDRPGQTRGTPFLTPALKDIKQLDRFDEALIMSAIVKSCFTGFVKSPDPNALDSHYEHPLKALTHEQRMEYYSRYQFEMKPGEIRHLLDGEEITFSNPGSQDANTESFIMAKLRKIGMGLGIPFEVYVQMFNSSYTASKGAIAQFWEQLVEPEKEWFDAKFNDPIYEEWLTFKLLSGEISMPGRWRVSDYLNNPQVRAAILGASWIGPSINQLDEQKAATTSILLLNARMTTLKKETQKYDGGDYKRNVRQLRKEQELTKDLVSVIPLTVSETLMPNAPNSPGNTTSTAPQITAPRPPQQRQIEAA